MRVCRQRYTSTDGPDTDFLRWTEYVAARPEITHIAYEFRTMSGRQKTHVDWLIGMVRAVERPLHLIMRGGTEYLPSLTAAFAGTTFMDTSVFMKTMNRQRAYTGKDGGLDWTGNPTKKGAPLDALLMENAGTRARWVSELTAEPAK